MAVVSKLGVKVTPLDTRVTLPVVGMYVATSLSKKSTTLYIDFYTDALKSKRSYKAIPITTRDPSSLFCRLCAAVSLNPDGMSQKNAALALASRFLAFGAFKLNRVTKRHEWVNVEAIDYPTTPQPWVFGPKEGLVLKSLWAEPAHQPTGVGLPLPTLVGAGSDISEEELCAQTLNKAET